MEIQKTLGKVGKKRYARAAKAQNHALSLWSWLLLAFALIGIAVGVWWWMTSPQVPREAPEAERILQVQANMPFQILIPAYMPPHFIRKNVTVKINESGPGGEPMVELAYFTGAGETLFLREWVPVNAEREVLAASRPIETKWGKGWLLSQGDQMTAIWVDVGPLRVSIYTQAMQAITREQMLELAETLGPASNRQVFSFVVDPPKIREVAPPPPVEIAVNEAGVQELTLVVTPGGYSPLRFAVKKGIPVRLIFRQLGQVGCGNELIFPADPRSPTALRLEDEQDQEELTFTPQTAGEFQFICSHQMYRGVMVVRE